MPAVCASRKPAPSFELEELLAFPFVPFLLPLLGDALLEEIPDEDWQTDCRVDEALGHLRVLVELAPRLALLERAAAQAAPLWNVRRDLRGVHVRVLRVAHDFRDHLDLRDVILRRAPADVEHAGPRGFQ